MILKLEMNQIARQMMKIHENHQLKQHQEVATAILTLASLRTFVTMELITGPYSYIHVLERKNVKLTHMSAVK